MLGLAGFALLAGALTDAVLANAVEPNQFGEGDERLLGVPALLLYELFLAAAVVQGLLAAPVLVIAGLLRVRA